MRTLLVALMTTPLLAIAAPAQALSCVGPDTVLKDAPSVFTGHVVDSSDGHVSVLVKEIWKGPIIKNHQRLTVDAVDWTSWGEDGSLPDDLADPTVRVFAPDRGHINPCSMFEPDMDGVSDHRPSHVTKPELVGVDRAMDPETESHVLPLTLGGGTAALVLGGLAWWRFRPGGRRG